MGRKVDPQRMAFWQQLIDRRQREPDLSVEHLCRQVSVSPSSFYHWQQRLRPSTITSTPTPPPPKLVPVNIVPDATSDSAGSIEIELPNQVRLRINLPCAPQTLRVVWELLQTASAAKAS